MLLSEGPHLRPAVSSSQAILWLGLVAGVDLSSQHFATRPVSAHPRSALSPDCTLDGSRREGNTVPVLWQCTGYS